MDKLLWVAMSGAKENFNSLAVRSNNLANSNTAGFKADMENARAMSVFGNAYPTRAFAMTERPGYNMESGAIQTTNNPLDIAIKGRGFLAVSDAQGQEAYTRFGSLMIDQDGVLKTNAGQDVLDENGTQIVLPMPLDSVAINEDGVITGRPQGATMDVVEQYATIKFVNPNIQDIEKGYDGLFRRIDGQNEVQDPNVRIISGATEASNVNPVEELTSLIRIQRAYDTQVKLMETASQMDQNQNTLLKYN